MIISMDGYSVFYDKPGNRIIILLPPTAKTVRNTADQIAERKTELSIEELQLLLEIAKYVCKGGDE